MTVRICPILPNKPEISIFLTGLLLVRFDKDGRYCDVDVHKMSKEHLFSVTVRAKRQTSPDWTLFRHCGRLRQQLSINVNGSSIPDVCKHQVDFELNREHPDPGQNFDFRWMVDLPGLHPNMVVDPNKTKPGIHVNRGAFHTAIRTCPENVCVWLTRKDEEKSLYSIGSLMGISIPLSPDGNADLMLGTKRLLTLKNRKAEGIRYEIYIENDPRIMAHEEGRLQRKPGSQRRRSDFRKYYEVIKNVPKRERYDIDYEILTDIGLFDERNSPDVPCMPVGGGG